MKDRFREFWNRLTPEKRKKFIIFVIAIVIVIVGILGYIATRSKPAHQQQASSKKEIKFDSSVMEKSMYTETKKEMDALKQEIAALKEAKEKPAPRDESVFPPIPEAAQKDTQKKVEVPPLPPPPPPSHQTTPGEVKEPSKPSVTIEKMGDIAVFSGKIEAKTTPVSETKEEDKKKEGPGKIYLPPSFMEATLLSGLYAPTVEGGRSNPVPVLLRIKDLAILPNRVKANLKGCFVIAEGYGDLATERANLRLVTLSCLSKKGQSVINQSIKGFVVDGDGKIGLKGNVVSKMGSAIARSALAGFLGGLGQAIQTAYTSTSVSLAGTTTNVAPEDIGKVALGQGLSQATQDLKKFYLDLAKQAMPVIEVGATKVVTLVISEGVELNVMDMSGSVTTVQSTKQSDKTVSKSAPSALPESQPKSSRQTQQGSTQPRKELKQ